MNNLEGKLITSTSGTKYLLTDIVDQGAQGVIFNEASNKYVIKFYKNGSPFHNKNKLKKLNWLLQAVIIRIKFIKPLDIFEQPHIGYAMKNVSGHISLNKLLVPARKMNFSEWYNDYSRGIKKKALFRI